MILFSVLSSLVLACMLVCLHPACFIVITFSHLKYTLNCCNFPFSSIIISSDSWAGRHHMLPWSAPFNLIQTWLVFFSTLEFSEFLSQSKIVCFLQVILGEEVAASKLTLFDISTRICDAVQDRATQGSK